MKNIQISSPVIALFKGRQEDMILRYQKSNDLALVTGDLLEIDNIVGVFDTPQSRQELGADGFGHSLDDYFILWVKGGDNLSVVSRRQFSIVNKINDFFLFKDESTKPLSGCANREGSKIFALSQLPENGKIITHYYETGPKFERLKIRKLSQLFPEFKKAFTVEVCKSEKVFLLGGVSKSRDTPMIIAAEFNQGLNLISYMFLDDLSSTEKIKIKRIPGYEIYVVSSGRSVIIFEFSNYKFNLVAKYPEVCVMEIVDFQFKNGCIWLKEAISEKLTSICLTRNDRVNESEASLTQSTQYVNNLPPGLQNSEALSQGQMNNPIISRSVVGIQIAAPRSSVITQSTNHISHSTLHPSERGRVIRIQESGKISPMDSQNHSTHLSRTQSQHSIGPGIIVPLNSKTIHQPQLSISNPRNDGLSLSHP